MINKEILLKYNIPIVVVKTWHYVLDIHDPEGEWYSL